MSPNGKKTILVVDDEQEVRDFLTMALEDAEFDVVQASDGNEALEKIKEKTPDLISLDLVMPKHSGAKLYHDLQKNKELSRIPVLIVTGHARDELGRTDFEELTMSGPGVYLEKPVKPKEYVNAIRNILHLEEEEQAKPESDVDQLKDELKSLVDEAGEDDLKEAMRILRNKRGQQ